LRSLSLAVMTCFSVALIHPLPTAKKLCYRMAKRLIEERIEKVDPLSYAFESELAKVDDDLKKALPNRKTSMSHLVPSAHQSDPELWFSTFLKEKEIGAGERLHPWAEQAAKVWRVARGEAPRDADFGPVPQLFQEQLLLRRSVRDYFQAASAMFVCSMLGCAILGVCSLVAAIQVTVHLLHSRNYGAFPSCIALWICTVYGAWCFLDMPVSMAGVTSKAMSRAEEETSLLNSNHTLLSRQTAADDIMVSSVLETDLQHRPIGATILGISVDWSLLITLSTGVGLASTMFFRLLGGLEVFESHHNTRYNNTWAF